MGVALACPCATLEWFGRPTRRGMFVDVRVLRPWPDSFKYLTADRRSLFYKLTHLLGALRCRPRW